MTPWVPGPAAKTSMPRDNEGDRWLCSLLMSTQCLWFCIWNRDVKLVACWTVKKKLSWITQVWIYFVPALLLFLPQCLFIVIIKVINESEMELQLVNTLSCLYVRRVLWSIIFLKLMIKMTFEIICLYRDAGSMRERGKTQSDSNWQP